MATLNNLIVNGDSRFIGDIQGTNFNVSGSTFSINGQTIIDANTTYPLILKGNQSFSIITLRDNGNTQRTDIGWLNDGRGDNAYIANVSSTGIISVSNNGPYFSTNTNNFRTNKIWHEGNDGSGSGLDADKVDGIHVVKITQAAYDALTTKDANTLYFIYD